MWYDKLESQKQYKRMSVTYHKGLKQMYGKKFCDSNHVACDSLN